MLRMLAVGTVVEGAVVLATAPGEWVVMDELESCYQEMMANGGPTVHFTPEELEALDDERPGEWEARPW